MSTWEPNLAKLRERFPEVAKRAERVTPVEPRWVLPREDSQHVAGRWLSERRWNDGIMLALSGWGDTAHVRALLAVLPVRSGLFVAEARSGELRWWLERIDCRDVLADTRLMLGTGEPDEAFFAPLEQAAVLEIMDVEPLIFAPLYNETPADHARFFTEFARQVDVRRKLHGTAVVDAALWQSNTFSNLRVLGAAPDVAVLRGAFAGRAMVIVSAGPSLDESLEFIRKVSTDALIVAVNSSYRAVRHTGIVPPLVLAADPRGFTARGFEGVPVDGTWLVTTPIVDPHVVELFPGRSFTWSGSNTLFTEIRRRCGLGPGTTLIEQGTVSACAVDLALLLGCDRVCLVGQDLAVQKDGRSHASDSFYEDLKANQVDLSTCRWLPGNTEAQVPVEEKLYVYLKTFTRLVAQRPQLQFLNTSRLGARIAGVPYADFDAAAAWVRSPAKADAAATIARRHAAAQAGTMTLERMRAAVTPTHTYARDVLALALRAAWKIEQMPEEYLAENFRDAAPVREAFAALEELEQQLRSQSRDYEILEGGRTRLELYRCREAQARITSGAEHARRLACGLERAWAFAEGAWFLASCLARADADLQARQDDVKVR